MFRKPLIPHFLLHRFFFFLILLLLDGVTALLPLVIAKVREPDMLEQAADEIQSVQGSNNTKKNQKKKSKATRNTKIIIRNRCKRSNKRGNMCAATS